MICCTVRNSFSVLILFAVVNCYAVSSAAANSPTPNTPQCFFVTDRLTLFSEPGVDSYLQCKNENGKAGEPCAAWPGSNTTLKVVDKQTLGESEYYRVQILGRSNTKTYWLPGGDPRVKIRDCPVEEEPEIPGKPGKPGKPVKPKRDLREDCKLEPETKTGWLASMSRGPTHDHHECQRAQSFLSTVMTMSSGVDRMSAKIKTDAEMAYYMCCFRLREQVMYNGKGQATHDLYTSTFRQTVNDASEKLQVPKSLMSCLLFRESRWNPSVKSWSGAKGLGQFTKDGRDEINDLINGKAGYLHLKNQWLENYPDLKSFNKDDAVNPAIAIPAMGLYLEYIEEYFDRRLDGNQMSVMNASHQDDLLDMYTLTAGAYNMGPVAFSGLFKDMKTNTPSAWKERAFKYFQDLEKSERELAQKAKTKEVRKVHNEKADKAQEVYQHMLTIRQCLQKDNFEHGGEEPLCFLPPR